jgi:hypothetical protein
MDSRVRFLTNGSGFDGSNFYKNRQFWVQPKVSFNLFVKMIRKSISSFYFILLSFDVPKVSHHVPKRFS